MRYFKITYFSKWNTLNHVIGLFFTPKPSFVRSGRKKIKYILFFIFERKLFGKLKMLSNFVIFCSISTTIPATLPPLFLDYTQGWRVAIIFNIDNFNIFFSIFFVNYYTLYSDYPLFPLPLKTLKKKKTIKKKKQ